MAKVKFDIWISESGLSQLACSGSFGEEERSIHKQEGEEYKLVHSFCAETRIEAMQKYYDYMDYGIYTSHSEEDDIYNKAPFDIVELKTRAKWWREQQKTSN